MIKKLGTFLAGFILCACASTEPAGSPKVAMDCGDAPTGSHLARRSSCVPRTDEAREEARKQADAMREDARRTNAATKNP